MKTPFSYWFLATALLLPLSTMADSNDGTSPSEVITRLVANASKNPVGPVENDVTDQTLQTFNAMAKDPTFKGMGLSLRDSISAEYGQFTIEGPMTSLYSEGAAAIFYGKVKLTDDTFSDQKASPSTETTTLNGKTVSTTHDSGPGFGESGCFSCFVGPPIKDAHVIATFCLVQQHGLWKVHGVYLSNDIIGGSNKDFIVSHLVALAKKS